MTEGADKSDVIGKQWLEGTGEVEGAALRLTVKKTSVYRKKCWW